MRRGAAAGRVRRCTELVRVMGAVRRCTDRLGMWGVALMVRVQGWVWVTGGRTEAITGTLLRLSVGAVHSWLA